MPNNYTLTITVTPVIWPGNNGDITNYSFLAAAAPGLPNGFLAHANGHFTASMIRAKTADHKIIGPVSPGDKFTFIFGGSTGFTVTDVTGLTGVVGGLAWGAASTSNGTTTITATVTSAAVNAGTIHTKYAVAMKKTSDNTAAVIDPDFETDVTDAP